MRAGVSTFIEWGAVVLLALFFVPRLLAAIAGGNARQSALYSPSAAAQQQAARAINTAGLAGNTALGNALAKLLGGGGSQKSSGGASSGSGGGMSPNLSRPDAKDAPGFPPGYFSQLLNKDGTVNMRQPDYQSYFTGSGPYSGAVNPADLNAPQLTFGGGPDVTALDLGGGGSLPLLASPDLFALDSYYGNTNFTSLLPDVYLGAPDLANVDPYYGGTNFGGLLPDVYMPEPDLSGVDPYYGGTDFSSLYDTFYFPVFDYWSGGGGGDYYGGGGGGESVDLSAFELMETV